MSAWLRILLGIGEGDVPPGGVTRFELAGMPQGFWAVAAFAVLAAAVALVVLLYRRETEIGGARRAVLTALRLAALGLVVLVLLNPRLAVEIQARRPARTLLLVDGSASMGAVDRYDPREAADLDRATGLRAAIEGTPSTRPPRRADLAAAAIARTGLAGRLAKANRLDAFVFDEGLAAVDPAALAEKLRAAPDSGKSTWIGTALRAALDAAGPDLVAGVVLVSDGRSNGGEDLGTVKSELESRGIPVHAVGIGKVEVGRNLVVEELAAPEIVEVGFPVRIRARVRGTGAPGDFELRLVRAPLGKSGRQGEFEPVAAEKVSFGPFSTEVVLNLSDVPPGDGRWRYRAELPVLDGEESAADNARAADVVVASEKCRVLLVAGGPTFEYRHVRNFFIRDAGIQVSCWLQSADPKFPQEGDVPLRSLPATEAALRPFDAVVLMDPDAEALPAGFGAALARLVTEQGGGLAFVAGEHHTAGLAGSAEGKRIAALLPVALGGDPGHDHRTAWRPRLTEAGAAHPLCQLLAVPAENRELWPTLPPFYFRFPAGSLKPAASSLWQSEGASAMAVHQAGAGRVVFIGTDDLYHWREYREEVHERFWSAAARFLAVGRRIAGTRKSSIATDRERYRVGEDVGVEGHVVDESHGPIAAERITVVVEAFGGEGAGGDGRAGANDGSPAAGPASGASGERREAYLEAVPGRPGFFRGRLKAEAPGSYRIVLGDGDGGDGTGAVFRVSAPAGEADDVAPDFAALEDLARATRGSFLPLAAIEDLAARIPDRSVVEVLGRKTVTVWDSATLLLAFSAALVTEWILRKKWRLC